MALPTHYKSPFKLDVDTLYLAREIYDKLTFNDLYIIPLQWIHIRKFDPSKPWTRISKRRLIAADTRYPIIIYESKLDPENTNVKQRYCIFDGNHRALKLSQEGVGAVVCFILKPNVFDGLKEYDHTQARWISQNRTTGCNGCGE
tara:strand:- start:766 stop:1200 length:435 start_codon:yes stop_codon:yes gene_type:complete